MISSVGSSQQGTMSQLHMYIIFLIIFIFAVNIGSSIPHPLDNMWSGIDSSSANLR